MVTPKYSYRRPTEADMHAQRMVLVPLWNLQNKLDDGQSLIEQGLNRQVGAARTRGSGGGRRRRRLTWMSGNTA